jgi:hypothetical protein
MFIGLSALSQKGIAIDNGTGKVCRNHVPCIQIKEFTVMFLLNGLFRIGIANAGSEAKAVYIAGVLGAAPGDHIVKGVHRADQYGKGIGYFKIEAVEHFAEGCAAKGGGNQVVYGRCVGLKKQFP